MIMVRAGQKTGELDKLQNTEYIGSRTGLLGANFFDNDWGFSSIFSKALPNLCEMRMLPQMITLLCLKYAHVPLMTLGNKCNIS